MTLYKLGSRGEMVKQIQRALHLAADGIFGHITLEAVKDFQRTHGLKVDGIVGPATLTKLIPSMVKRSKRAITDIIIHCTGTPEYKDITVTDLRRAHKARGFSDIGYHYVIYLDGSVHEGRNVDVIGAHCTGYNTHSIGVAYVGGMDTDGKTLTDTRNDKQKAALLSLLIDLKKLYPKAVIKGHRDYSPDLNHNGTIEPSEWIKYCPCFFAVKEYARL